MAPTIALVKKEQKTVVAETKKLEKTVKAKRLAFLERLRIRREQQYKHRGLVYLGHLPHGFYEKEIRKYFTQFGRVTNVKVCRSNNTGNSKGYGYVEFSHSEVAQIAAETMNNYIMFKKRLIAEFVPHDKRPKSLFMAKVFTQEDCPKLKRIQRVVRNKNKLLKKGKFAQQTETLKSRLNKRLAKIQSYGIDYTLKPVDVPKKSIK